MNKHPLPVNLNQREITWGLRYLLFELVFLGSLLTLLLSRLLPNVRDIQIDTAYFVVNLAAVVGIFHRFLKLSLTYGLKHWKKLLLSAGLGFGVYWLLITGLDRLIYGLFPDFQNINDAGIAKHTQEHFWITAIGTVILVPLTEETLFRGLIFGALQQQNRTIAYLLSVVFFAFVHVMGYFGVTSGAVLMISFVQYIPAGIVLALAYEFSGSILAPTLIHMAVNAIAILSMR